jgi:DNA-binding protein HU-beta
MATKTAAKTAAPKAAAPKAAPKAAAAAKTTATAPTVTLKQIAAELAEKHEMTKKQSNLIMDDLVAALVKNLKKGNRIRMAGLGILQVRKRAARMGRNPATGEAIKIPAKKKIAFRPAKELKEAVGK